MSLTPSDLQKIGEVVEEKIVTKLGEVVEEKVEKAFSRHFASIWEQNLEPALNAIHDQMATKSDLAEVGARMATKEDIAGVSKSIHNIADRLETEMRTHRVESERRDEALVKRSDAILDGLEEKNVFSRKETDPIRKIQVLKPAGA